MGTNFYAWRDCCDHCGRGDNELHIGKRSGGWTFSFQAFDEWETWDDLPIVSYQRWLEVLDQPGVRIRDEYGDDVTLDEFRAIVNNFASNTSKHAEFVKRDPSCVYVDRADHWLDPEGHSFSRGEFS